MVAAPLDERMFCIIFNSIRSRLFRRDSFFLIASPRTSGGILIRRPGILLAEGAQFSRIGKLAWSRNNLRLMLVQGSQVAFIAPPWRIQDGVDISEGRYRVKVAAGSLEVES